jgi:hypothetical protein
MWVRVGEIKEGWWAVTHGDAVFEQRLANFACRGEANADWRGLRTNEHERGHGTLGGRVLRGFICEQRCGAEELGAGRGESA